MRPGHTTRRLVAALLVLSAGLGACGGSGGSAQGQAAAPAPATVAAPACPAAGRRTVPGGVLVVPPGARPGAVPLLVVVVPGGGGDPRDGLGLASAARRSGLALLYPTSEDGFWSLNHAQGDADVTNVRGLLERTLTGGCFNRRRVTATGVSNGAGFATRLGCALPDRFAGVAPVSAGFRALDPCPAAARTSLLAIHGTADTIVPYNGRKPGREGSVPRFATGWARRIGCDRRPAVTSPRPRVTRITYRGCAGGLHVEVVRLRGNTHGWAGAPRSPFPQRNPSHFNATAAVVAFALAARRPVN
jgi:polyhydroxybutyrate depolymerase